MKKLFSLLFLATAIILASCSKKAVSSDDAANRLVAGENPALIISIKIKDLLDKGGISNKENVPAMAQMLFSDKVEYFTNPEKAGLDLSGKSYMAIATNGKDHSGWVLTKIKNKETFEKMLKEEGNNKFEEIEGYNTSKVDDKSLMAWNDHLLLIVGSTEGKVQDKFKAYAEMLGNDKTAGDQYKDFFAASTDIAFYNDMGQFASLQESMPSEIKGEGYDPEMMKKLAEKLKGSYNVTTVDFENDKIVADIKNHLSEGAKKEFSFTKTTGFPKELLSQLGSDQITGFFSLNTDVQKLVEWASEFTGQKDLLAEAREKSGLDIDRVLASLKGNFLMAFQGTMPSTFDSYDSEGKSTKDTIYIPRTTVIASISTDGYLEKLADSVLKEQKESNYYWISKSFNPQYLGFKPGVAVFTNDPSVMTKTGTPALAPEAEKVLDKPFSFYIDINAMILSKSEEATHIAEKFKYAVGGMDLNGGHAELILNNGGKNSLWTLINITLESTADMMPQM